MCYYPLLVYEACAHQVIGAIPLRRSPPCPLSKRGADAVPQYARSEGSPLSNRAQQGHPYTTTTGNTCRERLYHPFRTWQVSGLCDSCRRERDERLARLHTAVADSTIRIIARYARWNCLVE